MGRPSAARRAGGAYPQPVDDEEVIGRIDRLVAEEHRLERSHVGEALSEPELNRLRSIEVELDRCWDLLRLRRARRAAGGDPDTVESRPESVVEGYQQ